MGKISLVLYDGILLAVTFLLTSRTVSLLFIFLFTARAVYHQADISLIDDALSAVDAHVAKHIFDEAIVKELLSGRDGQRAVILATNALQHLSHPRVDKIVVMQGGRIIEQGTYKDLSLDQASEFSRFLKVIEETGVSADHQHDVNDDGGFGEGLSGENNDGSSPKSSRQKKGRSKSRRKRKIVN